MSISSITASVLRFVESRSIPPEICEVEAGDYQVARVTQERYDAAKPFISGISFPVVFAYRDNGKSRMIRAVLREIRQFDRNTFFFKAVEEESNGYMMLSSDVVEEIFAGETHYTTHNPVEGAKFGMKKARTDDDNPDVLDFTKVFYVFQKGRYENFRHKLHLMLFLAQQDGTFTPEELKILRDFIGTESGVRPEDRDELELYTVCSRITADAFRESLLALAECPKAEMYNLLSKTRELIAADGHVDGEESRFYAQMLEQLS